MRWILALSLVVNAVLGALLFKKGSRERLLIETHGAGERRVISRVTVPGPGPSVLEEGVPRRPEVEKMRQERQDFFREELKLSPEVVAEYERLKAARFEEQMRTRSRGVYEDLPISERRVRLDQEEKFIASMEKLFGKAKWKKYQEFRASYNKRVFEGPKRGNEPFLLMEL